MSRLGQIFLTWKRSLQKKLAPLEITVKQYYIIRQLSRKDFLYPADIAEILFADRPTTTVILDNLEKKNWIFREKDSDNAKYVRIRITEEGRKKNLEVGKHLEDLPDVTGCFDSEELKKFEDYLIRLENHLENLLS